MALGGLGGHFLEGLSRGDAKEMGDLLREGQAALIVIGESRMQAEFDKVLTRAEKSIEKQIAADREQLKRELGAAEKQLAGG